MDITDFSTFINEFLEETDEHIQTLNSTLLEFEKGLADGSAKKEKVDSLFRAAHTVKGLAGMMDFENVEKVCHKMEDIFSDLRRDAIQLTPPILDSLFTALDVLTKLVEEIRRNKTDKGIDVGPSIISLERSHAGGDDSAENEPQKPKPAPTAVAEAPAEKGAPQTAVKKQSANFASVHFADPEFDIFGFNLDEKETAVLLDMVMAGLWIYETSKEISGGMAQAKLDNLPILKQVDSTGMFIAATPRLENITIMENAMVSCRILFGSEKKPAEVREDFMDPVRVVVQGGTPVDAAADVLKTKAVVRSDGKTIEEVVSSTDPSLVYEFVRNALSSVETAETALKKLAQNPGDPEPLSELHDQVRSLKGTAVIFGFVKIGLVSGRLEALLDSDMPLKDAAAFERVAAECLGLLRLLADEPRLGKDTGVNAKGLIAQMDKILGLSEIAQTALADFGIEENEPALQGLSPEEKSILADELQKSTSIFEVHIGMDGNALEMGYDPISIVPMLENIGNIVARVPQIEGVPEIADFDVNKFTLGFRFLLSSKMTLEEINGRLEKTPNFITHTVTKLFVKTAKSAPKETPRPAQVAEPSTPIQQAERPARVAVRPPATAESAATKAPAEGEKRQEDKSSGTIRVNTERVDKLLNLVGEIVIDRTRLDQIGAEIRKTQPRSKISEQITHTTQLFNRHMNEIQEMVMAMRMVQVGTVFNKFPRIVRDLSKTLGKNINLVLTGEKTELDKTLIEEIGDPLVHLVRNAVDHGLETPKERIAAGKAGIGTIELKASHEGDSIILEVSDDGRGMNPEKIRAKAIERGLLNPADTELSDKDVLRFIFEPGFSTAEATTLVSGRGVGMDVVKRNITRLKGIIDIRSELGAGSRIIIRLPLTLAIVPTLVVRSRDERFAIPLASVVESIRIAPNEIREIQGREMITLRNSVLSLSRLDRIFNLDRMKKKRLPRQLTNYRMDGMDFARDGERENSALGWMYVVVVGLAEKRLGLVVDKLESQQEVVIKTMGTMLRDVPGISGATIMGDGKVALILDTGHLIEESLKRENRAPAPAAS